MEDEDGTCLLDVLCDPQALNDFLHGTSELENEDLLINSSPGEPSLFADAPSPGSLLADDTPSQDTPPSGCVDLSFLEEALLSSPDGGGGPEVGEGGTVEAPEEEEACDILRQSLQEADITEQTLALEAGLALPGDGLSLYNTPGTLAGPLASQFLSKPLSTSPLPAMPRDTQAAVEPPQPSLLAVGPGCPSLKPAAPQLMGLLPGTVFPGTPPEASLSLSPAQGSGMLIQKALPSLTNRPLMTATLRATTAPGILLPRGPLPIQPKLPVNIQPRLVQISPKPAGQKTSQSLTLVQGTASPNILLSPPLGPKPPAAAPQLSKPMSLQLLNQGGSIVIQPQGIFPGHNQFLVPSQTPVTVPQPASAVPPLLTPASQPGPSVRGGAPASGHLVDSTQILTAPPRQLNFSPVFTTPTGQLALRQGTLLSGPLQLQSTPPAVFQMPTQLTGTYAPQGQGPRGTLLQSTALGGHITLINSPGMLPADVASISIVNGPSVVQGVPFAAQAQRPVPGGSEGQQGLPQTPVLLLPETTSALEEKCSGAEPLLQVPQHLHHHASQTCPPELQSSPPVVTIVPPQMDVPLHHDPASSLANHLLPPANGQQVLDGVPSSTPPKHNFIHHLQQVSQALELPSPSAVTLQVQVGPLVSPLAGQREASTPTMPPTGQAGASTVTPKPRVVTTPTHPGTEQTGTRCSPLIGQGTLSTSPATFSSPAAGQTDGPSGTGSSKAAALVQPSNPVPTVPSSLPVSISVGPQQPTPLPASTGPQMQTEPTTQQHSQGKPAAVSAPESKALSFGLRPTSPKIQGSQIQGLHGTKQHSQATQIQNAMQPSAQVAACKEKEREEKLSPATRRHRFQQQLCLDHTAVLNPDARSPFLSVENAVRRLLPYHTCAGCPPSQSDFLTVDKQFEVMSALLLKRTKDMLNKYRQLLLGEAQQVSPSAEMVMLERLFLQAERGVLGEERRKARLEPESFLASLRETATGAPFLQFNSPPSPPSWALLSDRPPGLKTYRSSCRGALKLTIKHESGSRKVVHNSACDPAQASPSGHKQDGSGQQTNGGDASGKHGDEHQEPPCSQNWNQCVSGGTAALESIEDTQQVEHGSTHTALYPQIVPDPQPAVGESSAFEPTLHPPKAKRPRPDPDQDHTCLPSQAENHTLNEHLQSAIDSILELQRLQGPPGLQIGPPKDGASVLEQAVSSILEGQR